MPTKKPKIENPAHISEKVVEAVQLLQKEGFNVDAIRDQIIDDANERILNGEDLVTGAEDRVQMEYIQQCCPGFG